MKKIILLLGFMGVIVFVAQSCGGGNEKAPVADSVKTNVTVSASMDGKSLYDAKCTMCHGLDGTAGVMGAADLSKSTIDHSVACAIIKNGKNTMKAFGSELNDAQVDVVAKYVESLRK
jgi:mono/diheme cytochrome c family protein